MKKMDTAIVVALIALVGALGSPILAALFVHPHAAEINNTAGKNLASGTGAAAGDNAIVNNVTNNNNFYDFKPEDLEKITTLFPGNEPTPKNVCDDLGDLRRPNSLTVMLGSSAALSDKFPHTILDMAGEPLLEIDRKGNNGNLIIKTLRIYDDKDNRVAQIIDDGVLNKTYFNELYLRPDKKDASSFSLYDRRDTKILDVRFLNSTTLSVQGIFRNHGRETVISADNITIGPITIGHGCTAYNSGADFEIQ